MTGMCQASATNDVRVEGRRASFIGGAARGLQFAAAPAFAAMALLTAAFAGEASDVLCAAPSAFPLGGMAPMYALMSGFHLGPWLKLLSR